MKKGKSDGGLYIRVIMVGFPKLFPIILHLCKSCFQPNKKTAPKTKSGCNKEKKKGQSKYVLSIIFP